MDQLDLVLLLTAVAILALIGNAPELLHRADLTVRLWRNGYSLRAAWRLAEGR